MERISWDQYFMAQSHLLASRSTCTRLVVGATIVRDKRIIAGGYNGSISGDVHCLDEGCYVVNGHCVRTIHAEMNAILQCAKFGESTDGAEIYVTHYPCLQCSKAIIQAGIRSVYYAEDYKNDLYAAELFRKAGVKVKKVPLRVHFKPESIEQKQRVAAYIDELIRRLADSGADRREIDDWRKRASALIEK
ncbi:MAG: ComE operon protein 2 [Sporolactobacillus sp.]|jgi:dCMP deaminase|nr:ComE operon protein 2 [Sporolactobacillus sp.]